MIKKIIENPWWRFFVDILQIFSVLGLTGLGIFKTLQLIKNSPILIILFLGLVILVGFWLKGKFVEIVKKVEREKIKLEAKQIQEKSEKDFLKGLPSNKILKSWLLNTQRRARSWDLNSVLIGLNFYLYHGYENFIMGPRIQASFYSEWKNLAGVFYVPSNSDEGSFEEMTYQSKEQIKPFFLQYPAWKSALIKAYEMINDILPLGFELQIVSGEKVKFNFSYTQGHTYKKESFSYDGNFLVNIKLGKNIKI